MYPVTKGPMIYSKKRVLQMRNELQKPLNILFHIMFLQKGPILLSALEGYLYEVN